MSNENDQNHPFKISNILYFSSIKNEQFDYTLPIKASITKFSNNRTEISPSLFEYLCFKIAKRKNDEKKKDSKAETQTKRGRENTPLRCQIKEELDNITPLSNLQRSQKLSNICCEGICFILISYLNGHPSFSFFFFYFIAVE